jgi:hypothetical protein
VLGKELIAIEAGGTSILNVEWWGAKKWEIKGFI